MRRLGIVALLTLVLQLVPLSAFSHTGHHTYRYYEDGTFSALYLLGSAGDASANLDVWATPGSTHKGAAGFTSSHVWDSTAAEVAYQGWLQFNPANTAYWVCNTCTNNIYRVNNAELLLQRLGYSFLTVDQTYNSDTRAMICSMQKASGLVQDGILGTNGWSKLNVNAIPNSLWPAGFIAGC